MDVLTWVRAIPAGLFSPNSVEPVPRPPLGRGGPGQGVGQIPGGRGSKRRLDQMVPPPASSHGAAEPELQPSGGHSQRTKGSTPGTSAASPSF